MSNLKVIKRVFPLPLSTTPFEHFLRASLFPCLLALSQEVNYFSLHAQLPPELMSGFIGDVGGAWKFDAG